MKRLFIAVPIAEASRMMIMNSILAVERIKKMPVRWVPVQNMHLTVQFLGDVEEKKIPVLKQVLDQIRLPEETESLSFSNIGAFPGTNSPRVIWIGFKKSGALLKIHKIVTSELESNGFRTDPKGFKPHLTLGRVKDGGIIREEDMSFLNDLRKQAVINDSPLDRITLFESHLRPGGSIYTAFYEKQLK